MAQTFCWQPVDFRGCGDFISQKRRDILRNKPKHAKNAKLRDQTADCTMAEKGRKRDSEDREFKHGSKGHVSAQSRTHRAYQERLHREVWLLSVLAVSAWD